MTQSTPQTFTNSSDSSQTETSTTTTPLSVDNQDSTKSLNKTKESSHSPIVKFIFKYFFFLLAFFITIVIGSHLFSSNTQDPLEHHPDIRIPKIPKEPGLKQNAHQSPDEQIQNYAFEAVTIRNEIKSISSQLAITPDNEKFFQSISQALISNQLTSEQEKFIKEQDPQFLQNLLDLTKLYKELKILNLHLTLEFLQQQSVIAKTSPPTSPPLIPDDVMIKDIQSQIIQENADITHINQMKKSP